MTNGRILASIGLALAVVHAAELLSGGHPWFGVLGFGLAAGFFVGWRLELLRSVRTAVILLALLSVACVLGTLTVQRSQLQHATEEEFQDTVAFAWAHLGIKITHPFAGSSELPEAQEKHLQRLETVFGDDIAGEEREKLTGSLAASLDETKAHALAEDHAGFFALMYRVADGLLLTDLFHAWWFIALFYLLSLNLVFGALIRRPVSVRNLGFHGAHVGLVLVVLGATGGAFLGARGMIPLRVGQGSNVFFEQGTSAELPLGFTVRLDHFETLYHEDLVVESRSAADDAGNPHHGMMGMGASDPASVRHSFKLERGSTIELTDPSNNAAYSLQLKEIDEAVGMQRVFRAAPEGQGGLTAARLGLPGAPADGMWVTDLDGVFLEPALRYQLRLEPVASAEELAALSSTCADAPGIGTFTLRAGPDAPPVIQRVVEGAEVPVGALTATFTDVVPDFRVGAEERPGDYPRNPALRVQLVDEQGQGGEYLFFSHAELKGFTELPWPGFEASFDYDYWCAGDGPRVRLLIQPDGTTHTAVVVGDAPPEPMPAVMGQALVHPALPEPIELFEVVPRAVEQLDLVRDDESSADLPRFTALQLVVDGPDGSEETWLLSNTRAGSMVLGGAGGSLHVRLEDNRVRPPRDWRSDLAFLEEGRVVQQGTIEVNQPACYGGYCFYQSDADASRPDYSGLQVVKDPAWMPVKVGLWMLLLGISWVFYLQPVFDRRAKAARRRGQGGEA